MGSSPITGDRLRSLVDERRSSEPGDVGSNPTGDAHFCKLGIIQTIKNVGDEVGGS